LQSLASLRNHPQSWGYVDGLVDGLLTGLTGRALLRWDGPLEEWFQPTHNDKQIIVCVGSAWGLGPWTRSWAQTQPN